MGRLNALKVRSTTQPGRYGDGDGLWLQVRDAERRSWLFRYALNGGAHEMGLGPVRDVPLAAARDAARRFRDMLRDGMDPIGQRQAAKAATREAQQAITFTEVADRYIKAHEASWRNAKHRYQWRATLDLAKASFGSKPVSAVDTGAVMRLLEPMWQEKPETASRLRGRIESVLDYAAARGWRSGDNPARWRGHLAKLLPRTDKLARVKHHSALPWREIGAFMAALAGQDGTASLALRFTILTAVRTGEAIGARWSEIDLTEGIWTIPADRMKAGKEHRVPLSQAARLVLGLLEPQREAEAPDGGFVFPGLRLKKPLSNMAMMMLLRRMGRGDLTVHGFRSTFRDWCAEATNYPREVAEQALAHAIPDRVEAAYRRGDLIEKRRRLMEEWAVFCSRPASAGDVVPLRRAG